MAIMCLIASGCESMIDGIGDSLAHGSQVSDYQHEGISHREAEQRVFEDNYFDRME
jgi:hypothetical protein